MQGKGKTCDHMRVHVYTLPEASILGILKDQRRRIVQNLPWRDSPHSTQRGTGVHLTDANPFDNWSVLDVQVPGFPWCLASWYDMSFGWKPLKLCKSQDAIDVVSTSVKSHPHWKHWQLWSYPLHWITARFLCATCHSQAMALAMSYVIIPITTCV